MVSSYNGAISVKWFNRCAKNPNEKNENWNIRSFKLFFAPHMNALKIHISPLTPSPPPPLHYLGTIKVKGTNQYKAQFLKKY
jgi:hypothetical protein